MKVIATFEIQNNENIIEEELEQKICEALETLNVDGLKTIAWEFSEN